MSNTLRVAVAIIKNKNNEVLISLRKKHVHQGGLWEFPGGKLELGENAYDALKREIQEEINLSIKKAIPFKKIIHQYSDKKVQLEFFMVEAFSGEAFSGESWGAEGQEIQWKKIEQLKINEFPLANASIINALQLPEKYMITGAYKNHDDFKEKLERSLKNNISLVQLRAKNTTESEYKKLIDIAQSLCDLYAAKLLLNTGVNVFLDKSTDGFHLSSRMLNAVQSRPLGREFLLSVSCHGEDEIEKAKSIDADVILLSPVKETKSHPDVEGMGWDKFKALSSCLDVPVYALGGMTENDLIEAKKAGAQGIAAISEFWDVS